MENNIQEVIRERCPVSGKICYSRKDAGEIVNHCRHNGRRGYSHKNKMKNVPMRIYFCRDCGAYHTTHNKTWKTKDKGKKT